MPESSIYHKLAAIREEFHTTGAKKSGINNHAEFTYFELPDILEVAMPILKKNGCIFLTTFSDGKAIGSLLDCDSGYSLKFEFDTVKIAEPAKFRMNEVQATGAEITYYRRYLWFLLLDISNADEFDGGDKTPAPAKVETPAAPEPKRPKRPATSKERKDIKEKLAGTEEPADEIQVNALKAALKALIDLDPAQESFLDEVYDATEGLTKLTKAKAETIINGIQEMIESYEVAE